jgi:amino acid efflux transporter
VTPLSSSAAVALYVGALLGPSLLLLPGLAAAIAGPASLLAWIGLLGLSALLARVFTALGLALPDADGIAGYATAAFGAAAGRVVATWFLGGVVLGAPVVCLIGGAYFADAFGGGEVAAVFAAAGLLIAVVGMSAGGRTASTRAQLVLVGVLVALVALATVGSAPHARSGAWRPFAPHGWWAVGRAASVLMLSFVGWEAVSPLIGRLRDAAAQLPRVIMAAFAITATVFLALSAATIAVLDGPGSTVPLTDLLITAVGGVGRPLATVTAVALTLAATNAYLAGATQLAGRLARPGRTGTTTAARLRRRVLVTGAVILPAVGSGVVPLDIVVALPTTLFIAVYVASTAAALRLREPSTRAVAAIACATTTTLLAFSGWALLALPAATATAIRRHRGPAPANDTFP